MMDQKTLDNAKTVIAEWENGILDSDNPREAATQHLIKIGYLNPNGTIAERFGGNIKSQSSKKLQNKVSA